MASGGTGDKNTNNSNENTLLLYHYHQSYYSHKVIFALTEKKLKFRNHIVELAKFEQYEPWFMRLNPLGEVPVLKDGVKIIPDSSMIIDYLEDNFSNGDTPRLQPEKGTDQFYKVKHFRELLDKIPIEAINYGCLLYPEVTENMKYPKFIQRKIKDLSLKRIQVLQKMSKKHLDLREFYEKKLNFLMGKKTEYESKECLEQKLGDLGVILDGVEKELASHATGHSSTWLCSEKITVADISLSVLLHRLFILGLDNRYWGQGDHPHLANYYERLQNLDSFKQACLTVPAYAKFLYTVEMLKEKAPLILGAAVLIAAIAVGVAYFRKFK